MAHHNLARRLSGHSTMVTPMDGYYPNQQFFVSHHQLKPFGNHHMMTYSGYNHHGLKFLGLFTGTHLSICLLIAGFAVLVIGLLCNTGSEILTQDAVAKEARSGLKAVGVSFIVFGVFLIIIAIAVFIFTIRFGKNRVYDNGPPKPQPATSEPQQQSTSPQQYEQQPQQQVNQLQQLANPQPNQAQQFAYPMAMPFNPQFLPRQMSIPGAVEPGMAMAPGYAGMPMDPAMMAYQQYPSLVPMPMPGPAGSAPPTAPPFDQGNLNKY